MENLNEPNQGLEGNGAGAGAQPNPVQNNVNAQVVNLQANLRGFLVRKKINQLKDQNGEKK